MVRPKIEEAVSLGVAWLDTNHPNWIDKINLKELQMNDCKQCVLGQVFGSYFDAPFPGEMNARQRSEWAEAHGFEREDIGYDKGLTLYAELQEAWNEVFDQRIRKEDPVFVPM